MEKFSGKSIDSTVGVIGDNVIRVGINKQNVFEYFQFVKHGFLQVEGEYGNVLLSSRFPKHGIGIFYLKSYGYLFIASDEIDCRKVFAKSLSEFAFYIRITLFFEFYYVTYPLP